jgi:hypothetical protein
MPLKRLPAVGPDLQLHIKAPRTLANKGRMADPVFLKACSLAHVEPSKRQASKWNNSMGKAWAERFNAKRL